VRRMGQVDGMELSRRGRHLKSEDIQASGSRRGSGIIVNTRAHHLQHRRLGVYFLTSTGIHDLKEVWHVHKRQTHIWGDPTSLEYTQHIRRQSFHASTTNTKYKITEPPTTRPRQSKTSTPNDSSKSCHLTYAYKTTPAHTYPYSASHPPCT